MAISSAGGQNFFAAHPSTRIGYVSLNVLDISQSLEFYESILGFKAMGRKSAAGDRVFLSSTGSGSAHLVELRKATKREEETPKRKRAGLLYHFAILLPERKFLADALVLLGERRGQVHFDGMADHGVSESVYIRDPDSNGIELYRDRPRQEWPLQQQKEAASADGGSSSSRQQIRMVTEMLVTQSLLAQATDAGWKGMPAGTTIGHVHLHVRDLGRALQFYSQVLGLGLTFALPGAHFFAAGDYHHHVAVNTWLGNDGIAAAAPSGVEEAAATAELVGLNHFAIKVPDEKEMGRMAESMSRHGIVAESQEHGSIVVHDSDGRAIRLYCK